MIAASKQLEELLDNKKKDVKTDSYPMSIGELIGMYKNGEIVLRPEYQRYFRWTNEQKSKLIESILIGLPLPSFFMAQDENGNWEVVDGMQRLSTIFDFVGVLKEEQKKQPNYQRFDKLAPELFYLNEFSGKSWEDFSRRIQLDFKRAKIQLIILMRETSADTKFELFQRLNSGGSSISGQELRNAILAGENEDMLKWFETLARNESFIKVAGLSEGDIEKRYDMELVLRFMAFLSPLRDEVSKYASVDVYLTYVLREFIGDKSFDYKDKERVFCDTFDTILRVSGERAFRSVQGKFSIAMFEAIAIGIAQNITKLPLDRTLQKRIESVREHGDYKTASGSGKTASYRIPKLLELGRKHFAQ